LAQGDTPWNPSTFTDQVADVFYKQVIDTESYNANSMKLFPYDPSDIYENSIIENPAVLSFCPKMIIKVQDYQTLSTNIIPYSTVPNYSKALPVALMRRHSLYLIQGGTFPKDTRRSHTI
jgi:hypothetical protein